MRSITIHIIHFFPSKTLSGLEDQLKDELFAVRSQPNVYVFIA
jgi:hypothetical protein